MKTKTTTFGFKLLTLLLAISIVFSSCDKDTEPEPAPLPEIASIEPTIGPFNTEVIITGNNFELEAASNKVKFNGVEAEVVSAIATQLIVKVPKGAGTGKVSVVTQVGTVEGPEFTYQYTTIVSTFAGDGTAGYNDGPGSTAKFDFPSGLTFDANDNLYVADRRNHRIRKITPSGVVSTFAGSGVAGFVNGKGTAAELNTPSGLVFGQNGDLYVTEIVNGTIRRITPDGDVTTFAGTGERGFADGPLLSAAFDFSVAIARNAAGDFFLSDLGNNRIRKISGGAVSTLAGDGTVNVLDGTGSAAQFGTPSGIAVDANSNIYVSEFSYAKIRKITPLGLVTTVIDNEGFADGPMASAKIAVPYGLTFDKTETF